MSRGKKKNEKDIKWEMIIKGKGKLVERKVAGERSQKGKERKGMRRKDDGKMREKETIERNW